MAEFDADGRGESPVDLALIVVRRGLSGGEFGAEQVEVVDPPVQALPGSGGRVRSRDVEPGARLGA